MLLWGKFHWQIIFSFGDFEGLHKRKKHMVNSVKPRYIKHNLFYFDELLFLNSNDNPISFIDLEPFQVTKLRSKRAVLDYGKNVNKELTENLTLNEMKKKILEQIKGRKQECIEIKLKKTILTNVISSSKFKYIYFSEGIIYAVEAGSGNILKITFYEDCFALFASSVIIKILKEQ